MGYSELLQTKSSNDFKLVNTHIPIIKRATSCKQKFLCCTLVCCFFSMLSPFLWGYFQFQTDFIKEDELVFVSADKQETGERKETITEREQKQKKKKIRTKAEIERKKGGSHHISLRIRAHEYGGVKWLYSSTQQMFPKLPSRSKHN